MKGSKGAILATLGAGLLWGSSFSVIKIGLRSIDPYWFVFFRFLFASAIALAVTASIGKLSSVLALLRHPVVVLLGVTNALSFILQFKGQTMTTAANAALLINTCTIFVAIMSRFVFRERFGPLKSIAVVIGVIGVYLVTTGGRIAVQAGPGLVGDLLVLGAALFWTFFIILNKKALSGRGVDVRSLTTAMFVATAAGALPAALVFGRGSFPGVTPQWWAVPYTAVFCTIIPFFLWAWGLKRVSATTSSVIMLTEVVFALALAALLLGERLSGGGLVGSVLIMGAVALASRDAAAEGPAGPDVVPE